MIQGYAIYLRTHRETGKQYAGAVWGSKSTWSPEKATATRWRTEDLKGIRGVFGGFDSRIVLTEKRSDAPECSETLYRIRIAVDEDRVMMQIPEETRLNLISPLVHCHPGYLSEETARANGRRMGPQNGRKAQTKHKKNGTGVYGLTPDQRSKMAQATAKTNRESGFLQKFGRKWGREAVETGRLASYRTPEHQSAAGRANVTSGHLARVQAENRKWAQENPEDAHQRAVNCGRSSVMARRTNGGPLIPLKTRQLGGRAAAHLVWHVRRGIVNPDCALCVPRG